MHEAPLSGGGTSADAARPQPRARRYGARAVGGTVVTAVALSGALGGEAHASSVDPGSSVDPTSDRRTDIATTPGMIPALGPLPLLGPIPYFGPLAAARVRPLSGPPPMIARPAAPSQPQSVAAPAAAAPAAAVPAARPIFGPRPILGPVPVAAPAAIFPPAALMAKWATVAYDSRSEAAVANRLAPAYERKSDAAAARRLAVAYRRPAAPASTQGLNAKQKARAKALSNTRVSAHRGGNLWGPESTLATFRHAKDLGADSIEFDVQFTKDNVPVVLHDLSLNRTTDCKGLVALLTLKQLKACDAGSWFDSNPLLGERVPTLEEALRTLAGSGTRLFVHVKTANLQQARSIVRLLDEYDMNLTKGEANPATLMGDTHLILANLRAAGAKRLGLVFHNLKGWYTNYEVVVPFAEAVTPALVARAHSRGQYVTMVQSALTKTTVNDLADLGVDEFMVNNIEDTLVSLGRLDSSELTGAVAGTAGAAGSDGSDPS